MGHYPKNFRIRFFRNELTRNPQEQSGPCRSGAVQREECPVGRPFAPSTVKNGSLVPQTMSMRGCLVRKLLVPAVVKCDIRLIVIKKIELNGVVARAVEKELVERIGIRTDPLRVFDAMRVLKDSRLLRE